MTHKICLEALVGVCNGVDFGFMSWTGQGSKHKVRLAFHHARSHSMFLRVVTEV